jgi:hypothetical protein
MMFLHRFFEHHSNLTYVGFDFVSNSKIVGIQNLIQRNESLFQGTGSVPANGVALPFILVQVIESFEIYF